MDLMYIANASIFEDIRIMFATVKILFLPESTEGVAAGQTTAMDYENESNRTEKGKNGTNIGQIEQKMALLERKGRMCAFGTLLIEERRTM